MKIFHAASDVLRLPFPRHKSEVEAVHSSSWVGRRRESTEHVGYYDGRLSCLDRRFWIDFVMGNGNGVVEGRFR
jgi:hypothetical protein